MAKKRIKVSPKIKADLQKEINSECPFCANQDVSNFEIHHIDGVPSNSIDSENLLLLCPTCHTRIEKKDISREEVVKKKSDLLNKSWKIEFVSVVIDSNNCNWKVSEKNEMAFFDKEGSKSPHPILNFTFVSHLSKTAVLKTVKVKVKRLPHGLSGPGPEPSVLKPLIMYHIQLSYKKEIIFFQLVNPIEIPAQRAFMFQVELSDGNNEREAYPIDGRIVTYFTFKFSDSIIVKSPAIYFNCNDDNESMVIRTLS
jgi:hypothetical protein